MRNAPGLTHLLLLSASLLSAGLHADDRWQDKLDFSGFGSAGIVSSNTDELGWRRDLNDPSRTYKGDINLTSLATLGLQANAEFSDSIEFVGQVLFFDQGQQNFDSILKIASLNYRPSAAWQIRLGRNAPRMYLLSDSRNIGYAFLWTMPVQEFYSPVTNNYIDGIDVNYSQAMGGGFLNTSVYYGKTVFPIHQGSYDQAELQFDSIAGLDIEYEYDDWMLRGAYLYTEGGKGTGILEEARQGLEDVADLVDWPPIYDLIDVYDLQGKRVSYASLSFRYDDGVYNVVSEAGRFESESPMIPSTTNGYLSVGRHFGLFTPYVLIAKTETSSSFELSEAPPPFLEDQIDGLVGYLNTKLNQTSVSVGMRWDFSLSMALKLQWDIKDVEAGGDSLWFSGKDGTRPDHDEQINIFSARLDFIF